MLIDIKLMKEISQRAYLRVLKREGTSSLENIFESLASATKPDLVIIGKNLRNLNETVF